MSDSLNYLSAAVIFGLAMFAIGAAIGHAFGRVSERRESRWWTRDETDEAGA